MAKIVVSIDGVVIKEVQLSKERTTVGRRPYNDIVIDNIAVSGEHAILQMAGSQVHLEDMNSTNGTYLNGKAVKRQALNHNDVIEISKYKIKFIDESAGNDKDLQKTMVIKPGDIPGGGGAPIAQKACIKVLSGAAAGKQVELTKVVTTMGKPGVAVAAITKRMNGYVIAQVEGSQPITLNDQNLSKDPVLLNSGDTLVLAGAQMQFLYV